MVFDDRICGSKVTMLQIHDCALYHHASQMRIQSCEALFAPTLCAASFAGACATRTLRREADLTGAQVALRKARGEAFKLTSIRKAYKKAS